MPIQPPLTVLLCARRGFRAPVARASAGAVAAAAETFAPETLIDRLFDALRGRGAVALATRTIASQSVSFPPRAFRPASAAV